MKSIPLPSLSRSDPDFWPTGGYWRGSPWLPTSYMAIKALDARAGRGDYDILATDHSKVKVATIASYWPLLAGMPTPDQAERLIAKLKDPRFFDSVCGG